jgi:hypothetical protein
MMLLAQLQAAVATVLGMEVSLTSTRNHDLLTAK